MRYLTIEGYPGLEFQVSVTGPAHASASTVMGVTGIEAYTFYEISDLFADEDRLMQRINDALERQDIESFTRKKEPSHDNQ